MVRVPTELIILPNTGAANVAATTPGNSRNAESAGAMSSAATSNAGRKMLPDCKALEPVEIRQLLVIWVLFSEYRFHSYST